MKKIRAFVAIPLPKQVQSHLAEIGQGWAGQIPAGAVRWVQPHLMHATLRFLGDTGEELVPRLAAAMDEIAAQQSRFALTLDRPGCFPNEKRPRVVWVGVRGELEAARQLKKALDEALLPLGWELDDRSFRAHLTVGRVKDSRKVLGFRWEAEVEPLPIPVNSIQLIQSDLQRSGPVYTIRHESRW